MVRDLLRAVVGALALIFTVLLTKNAAGYAWMVRHEYAGCSACHVDPDGAGLLTEYGRAQGETLLRTHYGSGEVEEPGKVKDFLWGLFATPDWLLLGGSLRPAVLTVHADGAPASTSLILMEGDLRAGIRAGGFRASVSAGAISTQGSLASIAGPFVSREHWAGYAWDDDAFMVRAGRMNLPFGIRSIEHPFWVRATTRTDINDEQQHGVSFDYTGSLWRGSLMAILGNYQITPDAFRERGYAGLFEMAPTPRLAVGISSLVTHAEKDIDLGVPNTRQAHGLYVRASPFKALVVLGEGDVVANTTSPTDAASSLGFVSMLQADVEPIQGLHLIATGESLSPGGVAPKSSAGAWAAVHWFFLPHADVRFDFMYRSMAEGVVAIPVTSVLTQLHVYL
jgi:hypothetical protein